MYSGVINGSGGGVPCKKQLAILAKRILCLLADFSLGFIYQAPGFYVIIIESISPTAP